jgi:hypothetical protein
MGALNRAPAGKCSGRLLNGAPQAPPCDNGSRRNGAYRITTCDGFRHELARRATLNHIPDHQRRLLHARALAVLAEDLITPEALGALAFHADQAGDDDEVVRHGVAGAERASALGANRQAADLYALVLRHAETASREQTIVWAIATPTSRPCCASVLEPPPTTWKPS